MTQVNVIIYLSTSTRTLPVDYARERHTSLLFRVIAIMTPSVPTRTASTTTHVMNGPTSFNQVIRVAPATTTARPAAVGACPIEFHPAPPLPPLVRRVCAVSVRTNASRCRRQHSLQASTTTTHLRCAAQDCQSDDRIPHLRRGWMRASSAISRASTM